MTDHHGTDGESNRDQAEHKKLFTYEISDDELPSEAVIRAVAAATDTSLINLEPLYDVIDPNHLDGAFEETDSSVRAQMSFQFNSCEVTVTSDEVGVYEAEGEF